jgi:hypothetical protein
MQETWKRFPFQNEWAKGHSGVLLSEDSLVNKNLAIHHEQRGWKDVYYNLIIIRTYSRG